MKTSKTLKSIALTSAAFMSLGSFTVAAPAVFPNTSVTASTAKTAKQTAGKKLKNGTYKLAEQDYYNGYRVVMSMKVKNNKIVSNKYDYVNKKGKSKTDDAAYEKAMKKANGVGPKEYIPKLNEELIKAYGSKEPSAVVDTVSGATESSNLFVIYAQQLINRAQAGNHKTVKISNIIYSD
ncbi:FMN-binding protein [Oenococcus oeni X2L]|uniref:FMN-binding protein n=1 Tax=Oenococcus oeni TaxID=1247 RepID=UPI003AAD376B